MFNRPRMSGEFNQINYEFQTKSGFP